MRDGAYGDVSGDDGGRIILMGKIIIDQYIFCDSYESAKKISRAFENFRFKFYDLGRNSSVYAKRYIRKNSESIYSSYKLVVRYNIEYEGEFLEYGYLDQRTQRKYPELIGKLSTADVYQKIEILHEYSCMEDNICRDIYYYKNFEQFFNDVLKPCMNKIYMTCVIAFANMYRTDCFAVQYVENGQGCERGYIANDSYDTMYPSMYFSGYDEKPLTLTTVWNWIQKHHKYKKDLLTSEARPLTALTYAINRSNFERTFYAVVGLESVFTKDEKGVRRQLKKVITKAFPDVSEEDIDLFYSKRSDFAHGDIIFPDYYENSKNSYHWSELTDVAKKTTSLLIMTLRELIKNHAIKILVDEKNNLIFIKHQIPY